MSEELKPCPFCGGEASADGYATYTPPLKNTRWEDGTNVSEAFFCNCVRCGIDNKVGAIGHQTRADAVEYWNRRADLAQAPAPVRVKPDVDAIENGGKRWHGEDHRVVSVRWEPYKPDGARQMKAKGRWQEQVGSGDYWRWQNCERPQFLAALEAPDAVVVAELVEALRPFAFSDEEYDDIPDHQGVTLIKTDNSETINLVFMSDLRRARAALAKLGVR